MISGVHRCAPTALPEEKERTGKGAYLEGKLASQSGVVCFFDLEGKLASQNGVVCFSMSPCERHANVISPRDSRYVVRT